MRPRLARTPWTLFALHCVDPSESMIWTKSKRYETSMTLMRKKKGKENDNVVGMESEAIDVI